MTGFAARPLGARLSRIRSAVLLPSLLVAFACGSASAQAAAPTKPVSNSSLDSLLFYQLLIGELELTAGRVGNAYGVILDAARRHGDEVLFQRAVEIALQARAGDQALDAVRVWRGAKPKSTAAMRYQVQILLAVNRADDAIEPMAAWLAAVPTLERPGLLASLPRLTQSLADRRRALALVEKLVLPYLDGVGTRTASRVSLGRAHLSAGNLPQALGLARAAQTDDPDAAGPVLLALELLPGTPAAEPIITEHLARPDADPALRMAYARLLTLAQRYADAVRQLERLTQDSPKLPEPWLTLGALRLELKQAPAAETALLRYVALATTGEPGPVAGVHPANPPSVAATQPAKPSHPATPDDGDDGEKAVQDPAAGRDLTQAFLLLAQAAEQRGDAQAAETWLAKVDNPQRALEVQSRRASLLARQGRLADARALIRAVPERTGDDARAKLMAEAQMLRELKRWREAAEVLAIASARFADDSDLIYEQAMIEEKLEHLAEMERLLRRVMALKPDHPHAHNALGYSLADRGLRLPEARELIARALSLSPGDPFITDSLGWVEFRLGNREEALRLLRQAHSARPDTEIGAHLGEVLWAMGRHQDARSVWQDARGRDADNEVLRETLRRLKVDL